MNALLLSALAIFGLFFQVLTLNELTFFNYIPNILIPILIFSHFYLNLNYHAILFFLIGMSLDCSNPLLFGTFTFSFMVLTYIVTLIRDHIDLQIFVNRLVLIAICNGIFHLIYFFFVSISYKQTFPTLILSFLFSTVLNIVFSFIVIAVLDFIKMLKLDYTND